MVENYKKYIKFALYFIVGFLFMFAGLKTYVYFFLAETKISIWTVDNIAYLQWNSNPYTGKYKAFYPNTHIKQETWYFDKGKRNWEFITYHPNGNVNIKVNYITWEKDWLFLIYNVDWILINKINYVKWKREWKAEYFYDTWELQAIEIFKNDKIQWLRKEIYENGKIKSEANFKDDKRQWIENMYTADWILFQSFSYSDWIMVKWKLFYEDTGKIKTDLVFDEVTWLMKLTEYDKAWNIISSNPENNVLPVKDTNTWSLDIN